MKQETLLSDQPMCIAPIHFQGLNNKLELEGVIFFFCSACCWTSRMLSEYQGSKCPWPREHCFQGFCYLTDFWEKALFESKPISQLSVMFFICSYNMVEIDSFLISWMQVLSELASSFQGAFQNQRRSKSDLRRTYFIYHFWTLVHFPTSLQEVGRA